MKIEVLYSLVSEAIHRAETLGELGAPGAREAFQGVSILEQQISELLPASDPEGALARWSSVRAAISAGNPQRARELLDRFLGEKNASKEARAELVKIRTQLDQAAAVRFPRISKSIGMPRIYQLAQDFAAQGAPFAIA